MPVESALKAIRKTFQVARLERCFIKSEGVQEFKVREFKVQEFLVREFKVQEFLVRKFKVREFLVQSFFSVASVFSVANNNKSCSSRTY